MDARFTAGTLSAEARARSLDAANGASVAPGRGRVIAQTYATLGASLLLTAATTALVMRDQALLDGVVRHFTAYLVGTLALILALRFVSGSAGVRLPLFAAFSVLEGAVLAPVCVQLEARSPGVVAQAAMLTGAAVAGLTLAGVLLRSRTAAWGHFLGSGLLVLLIGWLLTAFTGGAGSATATWLSVVGVLIFSGLVVFETGRLVDSYWRMPGAYIHCAVSLYLQILNLFLTIAQLLSGRSSRR